MDSLDVAKVRKLNMCGVCVGGMLTAWMGRGRGGEMSCKSSMIASCLRKPPTRSDDYASPLPRLMTTQAPGEDYTSPQAPGLAPRCRGGRLGHYISLCYVQPSIIIIIIIMLCAESDKPSIIIIIYVMCRIYTPFPKCEKNWNWKNEINYWSEDMELHACGPISRGAGVPGCPRP